MANPYSVVLDGVTTEYTVSFTLVNTNDLKVDIDGVLVDPGDYSVDGYGLNDSSFRVTFTDAPTPVNSTLTFRRVATVERVTNFSQSSNWTSTALNAEFDNLINIINDVDVTTLSLDVLAAYWDADSKQIKNLADGTDGTDAINLSQLNAADNVNSITQPEIGDLDKFLTVTGVGTYDWGVPSGGNLSYDNSTSGLTATDIQAAIDEVDADLDTAESEIDTLQSEMTTAEADIVDLQAAHALAIGAQSDKSLSLTTGTIAASAAFTGFSGQASTLLTLTGNLHVAGTSSGGTGMDWEFVFNMREGSSNPTGTIVGPTLRYTMKDESADGGPFLFEIPISYIHAGTLTASNYTFYVAEVIAPAGATPLTTATLKDIQVMGIELGH